MCPGSPPRLLPSVLASPPPPRLLASGLCLSLAEVGLNAAGALKIAVGSLGLGLVAVAKVVANHGLVLGLVLLGLGLVQEAEVLVAIGLVLGLVDFDLILGLVVLLRLGLVQEAAGGLGLSLVAVAKVVAGLGLVLGLVLLGLGLVRRQRLSSPVSAWYFASSFSVSAWYKRQRFLSPSAWYFASST